MDEPVFNVSTIYQNRLREYISTFDYKVLLVGDGADELFGGYPTYKAHKLLNLYESFIPQKMRGYFINNLIKFIPNSYKNISFHMQLSRFLAGKTLPLAKRHLTWMSTCYEIDTINNLINNKVLSKGEPFGTIEDFLNSVGIKDSINAAQFIDLNSYLPGSILSKLDNASMSNGLEVRSPFLNKKLLNSSSFIPSSYKVNIFQSKKILRDIAKNIYDLPISKLPKKGFNFSVNKIIFDELNNNIRSSLFWIDNYIDVNFANEIINQHLSGKKNNRKLLWTIYSVANWFKEIKSIDKSIDRRSLYKYKKYF